MKGLLNRLSPRAGDANKNPKSTQNPTTPNRQRPASFKSADLVVDMASIPSSKLAKAPEQGLTRRVSNASSSSGFDEAGDVEEVDLTPQNFGSEKVDAALLEKYWQVVQQKLKQRNSAGDNIVVVTRTRPFNQREIDLGTTNCVRVIGADSGGQQQVWVVNPAAPEAGPNKFSFDYCMDSFDRSTPGFIDQKTLFETIGLDLLAKTWGGFNASIFAYVLTSFIFFAFNCHLVFIKRAHVSS
jgi:hypothetical protein